MCERDRERKRQADRQTDRQKQRGRRRGGSENNANKKTHVCNLYLNPSVMLSVSQGDLVKTEQKPPYLFFNVQSKTNESDLEKRRRADMT